MEEENKIIPWVKGNLLRLAIPLEQETVTEEGTTKEDYVVQDGDVITVNLVSASRRYPYSPIRIEGNVIVIEDNGVLDLGTYGVEVLLTKNDGTRLRSYWNYIIKVYNTNDVVLEKWDEFADISGQTLDASIFFFAKGDPFTYNDFTQEQLEAIKKPALDAADVALQSAQDADNAASNAENASTTATQAAQAANSAAESANNAAQTALNAADGANTAKRNADVATENANMAAIVANGAAESAKTATRETKDATEKTRDAIEQAQKAAVIGSNPDFIGSDYYVYKYNARLGRYERSNIYVRGATGAQGKDFSIYKTYSSVDSMIADKNNVPLNEFVLIATGNVEDEDNAKLFVRKDQSATGFEFLTDMSGAQGIKGEKGDKGDKGDPSTLDYNDLINKPIETIIER